MGNQRRPIPRRAAARATALKELAENFGIGQTYTEREVNELLWPITEDHVAARRYLVEAKLLARTPSGSAYWREPVETGSAVPGPSVAPVRSASDDAISNNGACTPRTAA